ncbi:transcription factor DYT1 [Tanacetum coccineum]
MVFPNLYEDMSSMVEETHDSLARVRRNKRQNYDDDNDNENDPDEKFKSKNLNAERKRREKLKNRMLELRSVSEVVVTHIDENKLWVKIVFEKKLGGFTKLTEALSMRGIELVDIGVTTTKGAVLVTSCIVGTNGRVLVATQVQGVIADIIKAI